MLEELLRERNDLTENDRGYLMRMRESLQLLADISRSDVLLYCRTDRTDSAVVVADAKPNTVPSIYPDPLAGKVVTKSDEPGVINTLAGGKTDAVVNKALVHGSPTMQEVHSVRNDGRVIAALCIETSLLERERQRKKSSVFRRALVQLRNMVIRGQLQGAQSIGPLGEHDGPLVVDRHGNILYISSIAENLYRKVGFSQSLLHGRISDLTTDESVFFKSLEAGACVEQLVQESHLSWVKKAVPLLTNDKHSLVDRLVHTSSEIDGVMLVIHDITEEQQKEQELRIKSAMIQEIHHRVKNNLQTIAALLRLQARRTGSPEISEILQQTINRILSIAVVHEFLSHDESSIIDLKEVCQRIVNEVTQGILDPEKRITISLNGESVYLPAQQATSCALIVNELLQNAVEHGFTSRADGTITLQLEDLGSHLKVEIVDDGQGLPSEFSIAENGNLGLQIVQTLVRDDLKGEFTLVNGAGVRAIVTFPKGLRKPLGPTAN
jgi:two-component sensor histidine kinase